MDKTKQTHDSIQDDAMQVFLGLLKVTALDYGTTFSIYTSKRGRTWAAFKTFGDVIYCTACEIPPAGGMVNLVQAVITAGAGHLVKMRSKDQVSDSWLDLKQVVDRWPKVQIAIASNLDLEGDLAGSVEALEGALRQTATQQP